MHRDSICSSQERAMYVLETMCDLVSVEEFQQFETER